MKFFVLHLSDIHLKRDDDLCDKFKAIAPAIQHLERDVGAGFLVISGDIAFSGAQPEYANAWILVQLLKDEIKAKLNIEVTIVLVPGNHDCDFSQPNTVRAMMIESIRGGKHESVDQQVVSCCASVQEGFFAFRSKFVSALPKTDHGRLYWEYHFPTGDSTILFRCYNTAWLSTLHEAQGTLHFPLNLVPSKSHLRSDYVVGVFHHPYNWMPALTYRSFRAHIEESCDLILTGHEHDPTDFHKYTAQGEVNHYLEGVVLQESGRPDHSGFHIIFVDTIAQLERVISFSWQTDLYTPYTTGQWRQYSRGGRPGMKDFVLNPDFNDWLHNPGAAFKHPLKDAITLADIYVPPNLKELKLADNNELVYGALIESKETLKFLTARERAIVFGRSQAGKSTLAKVLFIEFYNKGFVPVLVMGSELSRGHIDFGKFGELLDAKFLKQFKNPLLPRLQQLDAAKTVLILDDFDDSRLNAIGRIRLLEMLNTRFGRIFVLADDGLKLEEIATGKDGSNIFSSFEQLELVQFGFLLRSRLIDKWYSIGREYVANPDEIERQLHDAEHLIDTLLGRNYLPSYPIFVLSFLQAYDTTHAAAKGNAGTYGSLYEVLITQSLAQKTGVVKLETKLTYLSEFAFHLFNNKRRRITDEEWSAFHATYAAKYRFNPSRRDLVEDFLATGVINRLDDQFGFQHPASYYYFVARHLKDNLSHEGTKKLISTLLENLNTEEHTSIWLFLTHLSKDPFIVDVITSHARTVFSSFKPATFDTDVAFLAAFADQAEKIVLRDCDFLQLKEDRLRQMDSMPVLEDDTKSPEYEAETNESLLMIAQLTQALRTLEVLGQLVKNFPGSLIGQDKHSLIKECYELGLRTVSMLLSLFNDNVDEFVELVADRVIRRTPDIKDSEAFKGKMRKLIFWMVESACFGMVKRISLAAGHPQLSEIYSDVRKELGTNAARLIDVAIKLEHLGFPEGEIETLKRELSGNILCSRVLKQLVVEHFYLFPTRISTKQRICQLLDIPIQDIRQLEAEYADRRKVPAGALPSGSKDLGAFGGKG